MILMFGVAAPHDDWRAQTLLDQLVAWFDENTEIPLVVRNSHRDCLVSPPERGGRHVEMVWLECHPDPAEQES